MSAPLPTAHKCECRPSGRTGFIQNDTIYCNKCEGVIAHTEDLTLDEMNQIMIEGKALAKKIPITYVDTSVKCNAWEKISDCKAENCSWFNHAMAGLQGGDYPPGYTGELDR